MILLAGFRTPEANCPPEILFIGEDGEQAAAIAAAATHPRLAKLCNPPWQAIRHWNEEDSAIHEAALIQPQLSQSIAAPSAPVPLVGGAGVALAEPAPIGEPAPAAVAADSTEDPDGPASDLLAIAGGRAAKKK